MNTFSLPSRFHLLNGAALKYIAIAVMFIDHAAKSILYYGILYPNRPVKPGTSLHDLYSVYTVLRGIGRTAFPIFCFFLVEGFLHTRSRAKYALRLLLFALVSELPFDLALENAPVAWRHQNVYFTLLLGLLLLMAWEFLHEKVKNPGLAALLQIAVAGALMYAATVCRVDYRYRGLLIILIFYLFRFSLPLACAGGAVAAYWEWPWVLPAFVLLLLYNGERGRQDKYFFYAFYPVHLLLVYLLRLGVLQLFSL